jgi:hypothetical protein
MEKNIFFEGGTLQSGIEWIVPATKYSGWVQIEGGAAGLLR